jgi:hypothetical protein
MREKILSRIMILAPEFFTTEDTEDTEKKEEIRRKEMKKKGRTDLTQRTQ